VVNKCILLTTSWRDCQICRCIVLLISGKHGPSSHETSSDEDSCEDFPQDEDEDDDDGGGGNDTSFYISFAFFIISGKN